MIDILSKREIRKALQKNKLDLDFYILKSLSTQNYAKECFVTKDTIIIAKKQNDGIGRMERKFISKRGGCYFTLIKKNCNGNILNTIPIVSVAIATVLENYGLDAKIKWPNDILVGNKKICGILCNAREDTILLGIGLNVDNDLSSLKDIATSLYLQGIKRKKRAEIIADILQTFYFYTQQDFSIIMDIYEKRLNIQNKCVQVVQGGKELEGVVEGIDENGFLIIKIGEKKEKIMYGDISILN